MTLSKTLDMPCTMQGSPLERPFGEFVAAARVTQLGVVPALVRAWRASNCMQASSPATHRID